MATSVGIATARVVTGARIREEDLALAVLHQPPDRLVDLAHRRGP
jgi:hypothetical protein